MGQSQIKSASSRSRGQDDGQEDCVWLHCPVWTTWQKNPRRCKTKLESIWAWGRNVTWRCVMFEPRSIQCWTLGVCKRWHQEEGTKPQAQSSLDKVSDCFCMPGCPLCDPGKKKQQDHHDRLKPYNSDVVPVWVQRMWSQVLHLPSAQGHSKAASWRKLLDVSKADVAAFKSHDQAEVPQQETHRH